MKFFETYKRIPLILKVLAAIALGVAVGCFAPVWLVRSMKTFNAFFDQLLHFIIPLIIVGLVTPAIADVGSKAKRLLLMTAAIAYTSTVLAGLVSYGVSSSVFPHIVKAGVADLLTGGLEFAPYFTIDIPPLMGVMTALVTAFLLGLGIAAFGAPVLKQGFDELKQIITMAIERLIVPLLPLYIMGLFLEMTAQGQVGHVLLDFLQIIVIILALTLLFLVLQYLVAGAVVKRNPFRLLWGMMPAYLTALGTSSSAATIPVTLKQTIRNGVSEPIAGFVVPLCATVHLSGSMLKIVSCSIAIMLMNGMVFDVHILPGFLLMLGITMVAAPGVPGGAIMAAIGLLESMLGFTPEQQGMIITLYIAMDSFGTACNVTGDGAIALIIEKIAGHK
ncbi:MAG: dicarboxylate/amino acid:cation symporter [Bacteroidales bacterium]|nr:dicarboxylate/amino acid:cation symporter [Candidatus Colicola faecequi]